MSYSNSVLCTKGLWRVTSYSNSILCTYFFFKWSVSIQTFGGYQEIKQSIIYDHLSLRAFKLLKMSVYDANRLHSPVPSCWHSWCARWVWPPHRRHWGPEGPSWTPTWSAQSGPPGCRGPAASTWSPRPAGAPGSPGRGCTATWPRAHGPCLPPRCLCYTEGDIIHYNCMTKISCLST